ncbi:MAG: V-type ATPase subunit [Oscillospiraceae bacterium]
MAANASQALIPKARGMYAKRVRSEEYEELMRRRTVPEVAAVLKKHPYFGDSLATLSPQDPHRGQLEELLNMDIFKKFSALARYEFAAHSFADYFLVECEVQEIMRALRLLSVGSTGKYIRMFPPFLEGKLQVDLLALAQAQYFTQVLKVLRYTPYYKVLYPYYQKDPLIRNYPAVEALLIRYYYSEVFSLAKKHLSAREEEAVRNLFLQEAENYNLSVILRAKTYFGKAYSGADIQYLLLPYTYRVSAQKMDEMIHSKGEDLLWAFYRQSALERIGGPVSPDEFDASGGRIMYKMARRLLHLTTSPSGALAAFITLAKLERDNVVNVIEGVRYGLAPEKVRLLLRQ